MKKLLLLSVVTSLVLAVSSVINAQTDKPQETEVHGETMYTLLKPGEIPAIFEPEFIPAAKAERFFYPEEPMIVVRSGKEVKGYSTWQLDRHEVVNDYIDGQAITVTW